MRMPGHKLVLLPADPGFVPGDTGEVLAALRRVGLCGGPLLPADADEACRRCRAGPEFLGLVTFLGCSPNVRLEPEGPDDRNFCHLELCGPFDQVEFLGGGALKPPRCPSCRSLAADWRDRLLAWERTRGDVVWTCPKCGHGTDLYRLDWRRGAAFGRFALDLWNVYEGEAVPSEALLNLLKTTTETRWDYFYA